jgi:hypothetical protein
MFVCNIKVKNQTLKKISNALLHFLIPKLPTAAKFPRQI